MKHFYSFVAKCRQLLTRRASYAVWKDNQFTYSYSISFENRQYLDKVGSDKVHTLFTIISVSSMFIKSSLVISDCRL